MSAMPIYGKNSLKIFSRTEDALWLNLCIYHRGQEGYQTCWNDADTLTFDLFYGKVVCFPMHLYGKNVQNFKRPPLEPLGQCCSNFIWSLPGTGEWKIADMVAVHWPRWPLCPYMVKTFKNLLQNRGCLVAESVHKSSGMGGLPKLLK